MKKELKYSLVGGSIGFLIGCIPFLVMMDFIKIEILLILLAPLSLISKNMSFVTFSAPFFYAIIGGFVGFIISKRK